VLACRGVTKRFGQRTAVDHVSFTVADGEGDGLLGPDGAGKTTAIASVWGLLRADQGEVTVDDKPGGSLEAKAKIGYVPQDLTLYRGLSARENLRFLGRLHALGGKRLEQRIDETLGALGIAVLYTAPAVVREAGQAGVELTGVEVLAPDPEGVLLALTGKDLRD
jgi:ABC-2 type transport system ATP-binding protein